MLVPTLELLKMSEIVNACDRNLMAMMSKWLTIYIFFVTSKMEMQGNNSSLSSATPALPCSSKYIIQENGKNCFPFRKRLCNMLQRRTQKPPQIGCGIERSWRRRWGRHTHIHTQVFTDVMCTFERHLTLGNGAQNGFSCEWAALRDVMASFSLTCEDCRDGLCEPGSFKRHIGYGWKGLGRTRRRGQSSRCTCGRRRRFSGPPALTRDCLAVSDQNKPPHSRNGRQS